MRRYKPPYPPQFRAMVVELVRAGRTLSSLTKEFGVTDMTIRSWVKQADLDSGNARTASPRPRSRSSRSCGGRTPASARSATS
jgi:transposase-like protein